MCTNCRTATIVGIPGQKDKWRKDEETRREQYRFPIEGHSCEAFAKCKRTRRMAIAGRAKHERRCAKPSVARNRDKWAIQPRS